MSRSMYVLTGRVVPERAVLSIDEIQVQLGSSEGMSGGDLFVTISLNQIFARVTALHEIPNLVALRTVVENVLRTLVNIIGYSRGYAYDVEIVQAISVDTGQNTVFGIDIPELAGLCDKSGIGIPDIFQAVAYPEDGYFLRHALADVIQALKSPIDTGFFCYRAVETLKNCCVMRSILPPKNDNAAWELFRKTYNISKQNIMDVKAFGDSVRHGNYVQGKSWSYKDRIEILKGTWEIINKFLVAEKAATTVSSQQASPQ